VSRLAWFAVAAAGAALALFLWRGGTHELTPDEWAEAFKPRELAGVVVGADSRPMAEATVQLYEDAPDGYSRTVTTDDEGRFEVRWRPRATTSIDDVFYEVRDKDGVYAPTIALATESTIRLAIAVASSGRVVDLAGAAVAGAEVVVGPSHGREVQHVRSGADGRFVVDGLPGGLGLDVIVMGEGVLPNIVRRFRGGDFLTVRAYPGADLRLRVVDPSGVPVSDAFARLPLPRAPVARADGKGAIVMPCASPGGGRLVRVEALGYVPVRVPAVPHATTNVVLWPARDVLLSVLGGQRGIGGVRFEIDPRPPNSWYAATVGGALRAYPVHRAKRPGDYRVLLPQCPVHLFLTAPGFADNEMTLSRKSTRAQVRLSPLRRRRTGLLVLESRSAPDGFLLLVANMRGNWYRLVRLRRGRAEVRVPATEAGLQIGSPGAYEGFWHGRQNVEAPLPGTVRSYRVHLSAAVRLHVRLDPPVDGEVRAIDLTHERVAPPASAPLRKGEAVLWVRPSRALRIEVDVPGNHFPVSGEVTAEDQDFVWKTRLRSAAGLRYRLQDRGGNAVSFALARVWEPGFGGRIRLRGEPRVVRADAAGVVEAIGLRSGEAALELRARGFRTQRFSLVRIEEGKVFDGGPVTMEPAARVQGRVVDYDGKPVAGVWARVLEPGVVRLPMPGGGERDVYDLTAFNDGDGATDEHGRFDVADRAAASPLLALYPAGRYDLTEIALPLGDELVLPGLARIELDVPSSVSGVYQLLPEGRAVLIATDPPMGLRPMPVTIPAGRVELFVRLRNGRWAAPIVELERGATSRVSPEYRK